MNLENSIFLKNLGFDDWFLKQWGVMEIPETCPARVSAVDRDRMMILTEHGEIQAELTGKMLMETDPSARPTVGDWVQARLLNDGTLAIIHAVLPRKTLLKRKTAGKTVDYQLLGANIDRAFLIQSLDRDFNLHRLERYLVTVHEGGIEPVILFSKLDQVDGKTRAVMENRWAPYAERYTVIPFSNYSEEGLAAVRKLATAGITACLLGSSGVGKTTLLNHLLGHGGLETGPVRRDGKGKHVTSRRLLLTLENGGMIIDSPGMRELGHIDVSEGLDDTFDEIARLAVSCRFKDCTHEHENGCAVLEALRQGTIREERYRHYIKMRRESEHHQRSYAERRQRDKEFGKMVKSIMKHHPKRH